MRSTSQLELDIVLSSKTQAKTETHGGEEDSGGSVCYVYIVSGIVPSNSFVEILVPSTLQGYLKR